MCFSSCLSSASLSIVGDSAPPARLLTALLEKGTSLLLRVVAKLTPELCLLWKPDGRVRIMLRVARALLSAFLFF